MSKTIYLVTGAAGFLGSTICRQLVERGDKVRALVLPTDKSAKFLPDEIEICRGDVCDMSSLMEFFTVPEGYESIVLHIASLLQQYRCNSGGEKRNTDQRCELF